jgi:hypothetical protein
VTPVLTLHTSQRSSKSCKSVSDGAETIGYKSLLVALGGCSVAEGVRVGQSALLVYAGCAGGPVDSVIGSAW